MRFGRKQRFCCVQVSFCPLKRGNRAGSSRNESAYSRRGTQTSFPLLDLSQLREFSKIAKILATATIEKRETGLGTSPIFFATATIEKRETGLGTYLSESSQTHSEKRPLDFLSLRGKN